MTDHKSLPQRWDEFRPSKALWMWSCAGCIVATMIVGFSFGGWVTGGTAQEMAENAAANTRAQLMASVCVERFVNSDRFATQLAALKEADSWDRDNLIQKGGWLKLSGVDNLTGDAADLCAEQLAAMDIPDMAPEAATPAASPATSGTPAGDEPAGSTEMTG